VLSCLNKVYLVSVLLNQADGTGRQLDAGTDERLMLVSRDEQSVLVVSYKDVKACIASAFTYVSPQYFLVSILKRIGSQGAVTEMSSAVPQMVSIRYVRMCHMNKIGRIRKKTRKL
jgi:hypothetical protein